MDAQRTREQGDAYLSDAAHLVPLSQKVAGD